MLEGFQQQHDYSDIDFSFVYELDEDTLNFFFEVTDVAVAAMIETLEEDPDYPSTVSEEKNQEIQKYFRNLLDLYTDYELYEECEDIVTIMDAFENHSPGKNEEIVGNMKKNT